MTNDDSSVVLDAVESYMKRLSIIEQAKNLLDWPPRLTATQGLAQIQLSEHVFHTMNRMCDDMAKMASVPLSTITVVDDENYTILAQTGLEQTKAGVTEKRDHSLCMFVAASGQLFDINDLTEPERVSCFAYSELEVRAYLGAPVVFQEQTIGAFCVVDFKPREWSRYVRDLLQMYANQVSQLMEQESRKISE